MSLTQHITESLARFNTEGLAQIAVGYSQFLENKDNEDYLDMLATEQDYIKLNSQIVNLWTYVNDEIRELMADESQAPQIKKRIEGIDDTVRARLAELNIIRDQKFAKLTSLAKVFNYQHFNHYKVNK
jgi:hypothetical protein